MPSSGITLDGPQQQFAMNQVNPTSPMAEGVDVGMLVSYGSIATTGGAFTGMFFEFANWSVVPNEDSVLTEIFFETEELISDPSYVGWSGDQVDYEISDNVNGKPGGFQIEFGTSADPTKPGGYVNNGVAEGEHLLLGFTIDPNNTTHYETLLTGLTGGDWIVGAHLQSVTLPDGQDDEDSIWLQGTPVGSPVVPLPGAAGLGALGLGMLVALRRSRIVRG